jgi:hypothetical protein
MISISQENNRGNRVWLKTLFKLSACREATRLIEIRIGNARTRKLKNLTRQDIIAALLTYK